MNAERDTWIYGMHAVGALLESDAKVQELLVQDGREDRRVTRLLTRAYAAGVPVRRVSRRNLDALVRGVHQGVAASCEEAMPERDEEWLLTALAQAESPLLLVLDEVQDPHNLGACLRSADAAGALAVVVPRRRSPELTPAVRKAASGAAETMPLVRVSNLHRTLKGLQKTGLWLVGADAGAQGSLYDLDLRTSLALVVGGEGEGLRRLSRECCDRLVRLPMQGAVDSLNVSVAAGVCLFEAVRQRR